MTSDGQWECKVTQFLKAELRRHNVSYVELLDRLAKMGVNETESSFRNKLSRGKFTAAFLLQCLVAMGASSWRLTDEVISLEGLGDQREVTKQIAQTMTRIEAALKRDRRRFGRY